MEPKYLHDFHAEDDPETGLRITWIDENGRGSAAIPGWLWKRVIENIKNRKEAA